MSVASSTEDPAFAALSRMSELLDTSASKLNKSSTAPGRQPPRGPPPRRPPGGRPAGSSSSRAAAAAKPQPFAAELALGSILDDLESLTTGLQLVLAEDVSRYADRVDAIFDSEQEAADTLLARSRAQEDKERRRSEAIRVRLQAKYVHTRKFLKEYAAEIDINHRLQPVGSHTRPGWESHTLQEYKKGDERSPESLLAESRQRRQLRQHQVAAGGGGGGGGSGGGGPFTSARRGTFHGTFKPDEVLDAMATGPAAKRGGTGGPGSPLPHSKMGAAKRGAAAAASAAWRSPTGGTGPLQAGIRRASVAVHFGDSPSSSHHAEPNPRSLPPGVRSKDMDFDAFRSIVGAMCGDRGGEGFTTAAGLEQDRPEGGVDDSFETLGVESDCVSNRGLYQFMEDEANQTKQMERVERQLAASPSSSHPNERLDCPSSFMSPPPMAASELSFSVTENSSLIDRSTYYQRSTPPGYDGSPRGAMPRSQMWRSELMEWRRGNLEKGRRGSMITQTGH